MRVNHDLFICYSRKSGSALAQLFRSRLEASGIRVFLDVEEDYFGPFPEQLRQRIFQTPCFVALLTADCLDSRWVQQEIQHAVDARRKIVVVRDVSFKTPTTVEASGVRELLTLNHIPYLHEFSDEVIFRVLAQIKPELRRTQVRGWVWAAVACAIGMIVTVAVLTAISRPAGPLVTDQAAARSSPADRAKEQPRLGALEPASSDSASIANSAGAPAERTTLEATPIPAVTAPHRNYCYRRSGYDPIRGVDRNECRQVRSLSACARERAAVLSDSIWTRASECEPCNCPR